MSARRRPSAIALDSNVFVALAKSRLHPSALTRRAGKAPVVMSALSLAELASLAEQGRIARRTIERAMSRARVVSFGEEVAVSVGRLHGKLRRTGRPTLSLADAHLLFIGKQLGAHILTFDREMDGLPAVEVLPGPPG